MLVRVDRDTDRKSLDDLSGEYRGGCCRQEPAGQHKEGKSAHFSPGFAH
jgi:hypothetical protein